MTSNVRMIQAVVEDRQVLSSVLKPRFSNKTLTDEQFLHHVTLFYSRKPINTNLDEFASEVDNWAPEDSKVYLYLQDLVWSDTFGVEAVTVVLKNYYGEVLTAPAGKKWHITISTEGKPPVESNTLLNNREDPSMRAESQSLKNLLVMARIVHYK